MGAKCYALLCMEWQVTSLADTATVARAVLASLAPRAQATILALHGDLGAGKTTFVQALAHELGVREPVTSPTFVIRKDYSLAGAWEYLLHIDAYRLDEPAELARLDFAEACAQPNTLICIEWAERVAELLPSDTTHLTLSLNGDVRTITQHHA